MAAAKINPGRSPRKESGFQAFVRQDRDFVQIILLAAAVLSLLVTGDVGAATLEIEEAALAGESLSVAKDTGPVPEEKVPLGLALPAVEGR